MADCETCGNRLPKSSRYCPQCGQPVGDDGTKVLELPPEETGPVPVDYMQVERTYYGVTPPTLVLVLTGATTLIAVVLFALGHWPFGLIVLGVALLLVLVGVETGSLRDRAGLAADSVATRGRAARQLYSHRHELRRLAADRARGLFELGEAVYRGDEQATEAARRRVAELDELMAQREAEMQTIIAKAQERIHQRRLEVAPTEMVEIPDEPAPPGEQEPSGPAVIPEPYPPPDEGNPPQPAIIPEPGPIAPEERAK